MQRHGLGGGGGGRREESPAATFHTFWQRAGPAACSGQLGSVTRLPPDFYELICNLSGQQQDTAHCSVRNIDQQSVLGLKRHPDSESSGGSSPGPWARLRAGSRDWYGGMAAWQHGAPRWARDLIKTSTHWNTVPTLDTRQPTAGHHQHMGLGPVSVYCQPAAG